MMTVVILYGISQLLADPGAVAQGRLLQCGYMRTACVASILDLISCPLRCRSATRRSRATARARQRGTVAAAASTFARWQCQLAQAPRCLTRRGNCPGGASSGNGPGGASSGPQRCSADAPFLS